MAFIVPLVRKDYGIYVHRSPQQPTVTGQKQRDRSLSMPISIKERKVSPSRKERSPTTTSVASSGPITCPPSSIPSPAKRVSGIRPRLKSDRFYSSNLPTTIEEEEIAADKELIMQEHSTSTPENSPQTHEKEQKTKALHVNKMFPTIKKPTKQRLPRLRTTSSPPDMLRIEQDNCNNLPYSIMENDYYPLIPIINPISFDCRQQEPQSPSKKFNAMFRLIGLCSPKN